MATTGDTNHSRTDIRHDIRSRATRAPSVPHSGARTVAVRRRIVATMVAVALVSVAIAVAATATTGQRNAVGAADEIIERIGDRTADLVRAELGDAREALDLLALLLDGGDLMVGGAAAVDSEQLDHLLAAQLETLPQLSGAYVGFPDGSFRFVRREGGLMFAKHIDTQPERIAYEFLLDGDPQTPFDRLPDDEYDPRARPWYQLASTSLAPVWTDPYAFFSTGRPGVTTAVALRDGRGFVRAVVGVDVELSALDRFVDDLPIDASAEAFLVAGDRVVAAPTSYELTNVGDDGSLALATVDELELGDDSSARIYRRHLQDSRLPAWRVVVRADEIEFVDLVKRQTRIALLAIAVSAAGLLAAVVVLNRRLRRPIDELGERADIDHLTGLLNRRALFEHGARAVADARTAGAPITIAVLDIDDFKAINDQFGHAAGDVALQHLADAVTAGLDHGFAGRLGGDEFVIGLPGVDREHGHVLLAASKAAIEERLHVDGPTHRSTITIGATALDGRDLDLRELIAEADARLLAAKREGKDAVAWTPTDGVVRQPAVIGD